MNQDDGIILLVVRQIVQLLEAATLGGLLKYACKKIKPFEPKNGKPRAPVWVSDAYVLVCLLVSFISITLVQNNVTWPSCIYILVVIWPVYRLYEMFLFVFGWLFTHTNPLYSIPRSLFLFLLNLFEIAFLTTILKVSLADLPSSEGLREVCEALLNMVSITPPSNNSSTIAYSIGVAQIGLGVLIMICVIGGLAGKIFRRSLDNR